MINNTVYINGLNTKNFSSELSRVIEEVFLETSDNLSWLKKDDLVLLKPALNSPDPYPATTHPESVRVIAKLLTKRGARVVIGDQSGVGHVVHSPKGVVRGSSKSNFMKSGMGKDVEADFAGFEEDGWNEGFYHFKSDKTNSWTNGFYVTNWIKKADHIINLPRVSTHALSGVTLGFKNFVGILRDDSRLEFHKDGPFGNFADAMFKEMNEKVNCRRTGKFFERIVEISEAVKDKLRLILFVATKSQVTIGPDKEFGLLGKSHIVTPETGLVFASINQVAVEAFALVYIISLYKETNLKPKIMQKILVTLNSYCTELGNESVWDNPFIKYAIKQGFGDKKVNLVYKDVPENIEKNINKILEI